MRDEVPAPLRTLAARLTRPELLDRLVATRPGKGGRSAAVLALFADEGDGPDLVVIERAATLRKHAGQIAFPGGAVDDTDRGPVAAALRESCEEVDLDPDSVRVLGSLPAAYVAASGFDVTTVIGWWRRPHPLQVVDVAEVAGVHRIPVPQLVDPANRGSANHPSGYRGPAFWAGDLFIWGLTAHLVDGILDLAGWAEPWDRDRDFEIPRRFLVGSPHTDERGENAH